MEVGGFRSIVEPTVRALESVVDGAWRLRVDYGHQPASGSLAAQEQLSESGFVGAWGKEPVKSAHTWAGILLHASDDYARSVVSTITAEGVVFSPTVLARAALEALGRCYWFSDPGLDVRQRVARWETERLYNFYELGRVSPTLADTTEKKKQITDEATRQGFELIRGRKEAHTHIQARRPGNGAVVKQLLLDDPDAEDGLGKTVWHYYCAASHGTLYGVLQSVEAVHGGEPGMGLIRMTAQQAVQLCSVLLYGYGLCFGRYASFRGWDATDWLMDWHNSLQIARRHF